MTKVEHTLKFVTEFDESHPTSQRFLATFDKHERVMVLESMLKDLIAPALMPRIEEINAGGSYAILKLAE